MPLEIEPDDLDRWELLVKGSNRTGWVSVTEAVYDSARAGAHWQAAGS